ncbi:hypothetical protein AOLI_G00120120 [Acnodon oligacanthus]
MNVACGLCTFFVLFLGAASVNVQQSSLLFAKQNDTVKIECSHSDSAYIAVLWYQQKSNSAALALIGYTVGKGNPNNEERFQERFTLNRQTTVEGDLTISELQQSDSAVYYCADGNGGKYCLLTKGADIQKDVWHFLFAGHFPRCLFKDGRQCNVSAVSTCDSKSYS